MVTLGVDLAASPKRTAVCEIHWADGKGEIRDAHVGATDEQLLEAFERADKVGIDAPFGWPDAFVKAIAAHHEGGLWPGANDKQLQYRATDREVHRLIGRWPLSVSSDRIGVTAMRCARLLSTYGQRHGPVPRDGSGKLVEVYPAAALKVWGQPSTGYKGRTGADVRAKLVEWLQAASAHWLDADDEVWTRCRESDDVLDAVIASLAARLAALGQCRLVPNGLVASATVEGWIAIPEQGILSNLADEEIETSCPPPAPPRRSDTRLHPITLGTDHVPPLDRREESIYGVFCRFR